MNDFFQLLGMIVCMATLGAVIIFPIAFKPPRKPTPEEQRKNIRKLMDKLGKL